MIEVTVRRVTYHVHTLKDLDTLLTCEDFFLEHVVGDTHS